MEFLNSGGSITITPEQHQSLLSELEKKSSEDDNAAEERALPWSHEEELFVCRPGQPENGAHSDSWRAFVVKMLLMLACSSFLMIARLKPKAKAGWMATSVDVSAHKYYV